MNFKKYGLLLLLFVGVVGQVHVTLATEHSRPLPEQNAFEDDDIVSYENLDSPDDAAIRGLLIAIHNGDVQLVVQLIEQLTRSGVSISKGIRVPGSSDVVNAMDIALRYISSTGECISRNPFLVINRIIIFQHLWLKNITPINGAALRKLRGIRPASNSL